MATMPNTVLLEADANGADPFFQPIGKSLRGRLDIARIQTKRPGVLVPEHLLGCDIPGQQLFIDWANNRAEIRDPLHEPAQRENRAMLAKAGWTLPAAATTISNFHAPTFYHWTNRLIAEGVLKVVSGQMPTTPPEGKPRKSFFSTAQETPAQKQLGELTELVKQQSGTLDKLAGALTTLANAMASALPGKK